MGISSIALPILIWLFPVPVYSAGGMAELKSLTGDAPYLGFGNQEQAPEFFASQLYSRYYDGNPFPYTRYGRNWANRYPYYDYMQRYGYGGYPGYGGGGCSSGCPLAQRQAYNIRYAPRSISSSVSAESIETPEQIRPVSTIPNVAGPQPAIASLGGGSALGLGGIYQGRGNEWVTSKTKRS